MRNLYTGVMNTVNIAVWSGLLLTLKLGDDDQGPGTRAHNMYEVQTKLRWIAHTPDLPVGTLARLTFHMHESSKA